MAEVLPFPISKRRPFIEKQARWFAEQQHETAERQLAAQLNLQRQTMLKRGVASDLVDAEIVAAEGAIRATVWRILLLDGGVA